MKLTWHPFAERFPLLDGAEAQALDESIKSTNGNAEDPIRYRVVGRTMQGLDGRNREASCKRLGIKPTYQKVKVADEDAKAYIYRRNVPRRNIPTALRDELIAELRSEGKSERQIAEEMGISQPTVHRALASGDSCESPETVTGQDGKTYSATKPPKAEEAGDAYEGPILCGRCARIGRETPSTGCAACQELRRKPSGTRGSRGGPKNGQPVYTLKQFDEHFGALVRETSAMCKHFGKMNGPEHEAIRATLKTLLDQYRETVKDFQKAMNARSRG